MYSDVDAQAGFLEAICADPHDVAVRLIYADWLEEHAEGIPCPTGCQKVGGIYKVDGSICPTCCGATGLVPDGLAQRAAFIRVQCELAREANHPRAIPMTDMRENRRERVQALRRRERELLASHTLVWISLPAAHHCGFGPSTCTVSVWFDGNGGHACEFTFRRGFVEKVKCRCADWLKHGPTIVRCQPVTEVRLTDKKPDMVINEYWWYDIDENTPSNPVAVASIPLAIFLKMWDSCAGYGICHPNESSAMNDLKQACLAWARAAHPDRGLSALPGMQ